MHGIFNAFVNQITEWVNTVFSFLSISLENYGVQDQYEINGEQFQGLNALQMAQDYGGIFVVFGMALLILLWGIGIMQTTISTELFTMRGFAKTVGRFLVAFVLLSCSGIICLGMLETGSSITRAILDTDLDLQLAFNQQSLWRDTSTTPLIAEALNFVSSIVAFIPLFLVMLVVLVVNALVVVKLMMRTFQIAILVTISPCFFACTVSESSMDYFKKFLNAFLSTVCEVIFMALIYAAGKTWLNGNNHDFFDHPIQWTVIVVSMGAMMIKPPQFLRGLV